MSLIKHRRNNIAVRSQSDQGGVINFRRTILTPTVQDGRIVVKQKQLSIITKRTVDRVTFTRTIREIIKQVPGGPQGPKGETGTPFIKVPFSFSDSSPLTLLSVEDGDCILQTELDITEAFDDSSATLSIGTAADPELIIAESENKPSTVVNYGDDGNYKFTMSENVRLFINPGASTQGGGYVVITKM